METNSAIARSHGRATGRAEKTHREKGKYMNRTNKSILIDHKDKKLPSLQSHVSSGAERQAPFLPEGAAWPGAHQEQVTRNQAPIGRINRRIYWSVFLGSLLLLIGMVNMIAQGALAISFENTIPLSITGTTITLEHFAVTTGFSGGVPVLITRTDLLANNFTLSQKLNVPLVGMVTLHLHADHADIRGLITRSVAGTQPVTQIADPYESIESATFQSASVWITKD
jgi:hypothetical protein